MFCCPLRNQKTSQMLKKVSGSLMRLLACLKRVWSVCRGHTGYKGSLRRSRGEFWGA